MNSLTLLVKFWMAMSASKNATEPIHSMKFANSFANSLARIENSDSLRIYSEHLNYTSITGTSDNDTPTKFDPTYPLTKPLIINGQKSFKIGIIADLDKSSKMSKEAKEWHSYLKSGRLSMGSKNDQFTVNWEEGEKEIQTGYAFRGRGMELSELIVYNGKLFTFDDRTGIVFEVEEDGALPWVILRSPKGKRFKIEWATVKGEELYVGSTGKYWTSPTGEIISKNDLTVKVVSRNGHISSQDWTNHYKTVQSAMNISFPGYLTHESVVWSPELKRWYFLPRRCSHDAYNATLDEHKGCNALISADEKFEDLRVVTIGEINDERGYSSFKFIPGTKDKLIIAIKTEEVEDRTATFITIFDIDGKIYLNDQKIPNDHKYEGLEFI